jgi:hypothetical protein
MERLLENWDAKEVACIKELREDIKVKNRT